MRKSLFLIPCLILILSGCGLFDSGDARKPALVGEWKDTYEYDHTVADSLYRDSLTRYMAARGLDLDSFYTFSATYSLDTATYFKAIREFDWTCPAEADCGHILWSETRKKIITADSIFSLGYKDGVVTDSSSVAYSYTSDSLLYQVVPGYEYAQHYEFRAGGDTLILFGPESRYIEMNDTLVRLR